MYVIHASIVDASLDLSVCFKKYIDVERAEFVASEWMTRLLRGSLRGVSRR